MHTTPTEPLRQLSQNYWPNCFHCIHHSGEPPRPRSTPTRPCPKTTTPHPTRGPLCIPPLARHPTIPHQEHTRYYGSSILRRHKKQQPHRPRFQGPILRREIPPCNTRCGAHLTQVHNPRTTYLLRSRRIIPPSKGHSGYTISFHGTTGTFHNRSVKQTAVATSSTHAEARAIFTLAKELNFLIALCQELRIPLELPAIIIEDNSAVVTLANTETSYA